MPNPGRLTNRETFFSTKDKLRAWRKLADLVAMAGVDQIPCSNAPDLFFPDADDPTRTNSAQLNVKNAVRMCKEACPIMEQCASYAIEYREEYGVCGGMTSAQRKRIRKVSR